MVTSNVLMVMVVIMMTIMTMTEAQQDFPPCADELMPCIFYEENLGPLDPCCSGLREVVNNELPCLCDLINIPDPWLLSPSPWSESITFKVANESGVIDFPELKDCGLPNKIFCNETTAGGHHKNGVGRIAGTGISCLLLFSALLMLW